jgi:hypothetical protein
VSSSIYRSPSKPHRVRVSASSVKELARHHRRRDDRNRSGSPARRQGVDAVQRPDRRAHNRGDGVVVPGVVDRAHDGLLRVVRVASSGCRAPKRWSPVRRRPNASCCRRPVRSDSVQRRQRGALRQIRIVGYRGRQPQVNVARRFCRFPARGRSPCSVPPTMPAQAARHAPATPTAWRRTPRTRQSRRCRCA